ncbi:Ldh family oxidoreductase [Candidatus Poribacteria bacterium]|nr:Ldh family oxidoreductase [Candidatus Poribacteria bacterium]
MQISIDAARELAEAFLNQCGMSVNDAAIISDILLEAELRGRKTHGFIRLPAIKNKYQQSEHTEIQIDKEEGQCVHVNGGNQPGYLVAYRAMEIAINKAKLNGTAIVGVYNTSHCGMAGYYADMARKEDLVGLFFADCLPRITPEGGTESVLGTNPIAIGIPSNTIPILFDMSTASITNGDLLVAMRDGVSIPAGIAFDSDGEPTTDPEQALKGSVKPYGGHKGFGLALITQILAGALVNASTIPFPGTNYGLLIIVLNPTIFVTSEHFKNEVDSLIDRVKNSRHETNVDEILIPGERAYRQREINIKLGINLDNELVTQLTV